MNAANLTPETSNLVYLCFLALLSSTSAVIIQLARMRSDVKRTKATVEDIQTDANTVKEAALTTQANTKKVGNGFADHVVGSLNGIQADILALQSRMARIERKIDNGNQQHQQDGNRGTHQEGNRGTHQQGNRRNRGSQD